jgi:glycosyltransferase, group 2 family|nr:glycosyltransferase family 2 protein [uncultured Prevotella sp.]
MLLSIIIPIYRVEDTIQRCLESVLMQLDDRMELIIIDDGSPDDSAKIASRMIQGRANCTLIHQSNQGLSAARNTGLEHAQGEYVTFIDSDDFIQEGTIEALLAVLDMHPEYDILEYPVMQHHGNKQCEKLLTFSEKAFTSDRDYWLGGGYLHTYACNKYYRRRLFEGVRYPVGKAFEDAYTLPFLLAKAGVIGTTGRGLYYYTDNPQGITARAGGQELTHLLEAHLRHLAQWGTLTAAYYESLLNIQMDVYEATKAAPVLPVLPYKGTTKLLILHLIGLKRLCQLNQFIHKMGLRNR